MLLHVELEFTCLSGLVINISLCIGYTIYLYSLYSEQVRSFSEQNQFLGEQNQYFREQICWLEGRTNSLGQQITEKDAEMEQLRRQFQVGWRNECYAKE